MSSTFMGEKTLLTVSLFKSVSKEDPYIPHLVNTCLKVSVNLWISPFFLPIYLLKKPRKLYYSFPHSVFC